MNERFYTFILAAGSGINLRGCQFEGRNYQDGEDWKPDTCAVCRCVRGKVECSREGCPGINNNVPALIMSFP